MGNLFYDEPRIESGAPKFKPGDKVKVLRGINAGIRVEFVAYTGADRHNMAYQQRDGPNPECKVKADDRRLFFYFAESDLELIAVQETQHEQPAAEPSHIANAAAQYVTFGPAARVIGRTQD